MALTTDADTLSLVLMIATMHVVDLLPSLHYTGHILCSMHGHKQGGTAFIYGPNTR